MDNKESSNKKEKSDSRTPIAVAVIGAAGIIVGALVSHAPGVNIFNEGSATPHPTVTITVTRSVGVVSGNQPVNPGSLENALLPAKVVGSGMSAPSSIDSFLSDVMQNAQICNGQPADGTWPTVTEELTDSPKSTTIFTERIINWGTPDKATQSINNDEAALGANGCKFTTNQITQTFGTPDPGAAPQDCGGGGEFVASVSLSSTTPNSNYSNYAGYFIEEQCKTFTISIEDMNTNIVDGISQAQVDGDLGHAEGKLLSTIQ